jgi:hypothetical protein
MAKKQKIQLQQSQALETIDAELAAAMDALDKKNEEVAGVLAEFVPPPPVPESGVPAAPEPQAEEMPESL